MAGAGVRLFTAGSILTASQVNDYLMDQAVCRFADSASRDAAFGGVGEPVLSEGRICYLDSDNKLYVYTGSSWVEIQSGIAGTAGQVVVYNSGGSPTATTLSGDVTVNSSGVTAIGSGVIVNADVSASAGIALSKLASATAGQVVVHGATGVPTATTITGDVTVNSSGVTAIGSGVIVNADVNASAAISHSKLANITAGSVLMGNASNVPTATALSGDVTVNSTGVTAISSGVVVNADISASASIALSKLASATPGQLIVHNATGVPTATTITGDVTVASDGATSIASGVIVNADISASAAVAYSKLNLSGSIVNADISSSAAIELNKLADVTIDRKTSGYTLASTDKNKIIEMDVGTAHQLAVPLNSTAPLPVGTEITIIQQGAGKTQIAGAVGVTLRSTPGLYLRAQYSSATLIKRATDEWYVIGDLSAT